MKPSKNPNADRRTFLRKLFNITTFSAAIYQFVSPTALEHIYGSSDKDVLLTEKNENNDHSEMRSRLFAADLARTYDIALEDALDLTYAIKQEARGYATAAITAGLMSHEMTLELLEKTDREQNISLRIERVIGGMATAHMLTPAAQRVSDMIKTSPLRSPSYVATQYGMSNENAERFCENYERDYAFLTLAAVIANEMTVTSPEKTYTPG